MCELLGFSAREPHDIRAQLRTFYTHSVQHPHGYGLMYSGGVVKEPVRAADSDSLHRLVDGLSPQKILLGHIRFATVGSIRPENCHPFYGKDDTGRTWTMIHNGTIYSGRRLISALNRQVGDTDSERLFLFLIRCVNAVRPQSAAERFALVDGLVRDIAPRNKLNLMIYDGELLYIHKNMEETMYYRQLGSGYLFATSPVDAEAWQEVPIAQVTAYRDGEQVFAGEVHDGIFVPTLQYITAADAMNI